MLSQPAFDWKASDRYVGLLNFEMEIENLLQAMLYYLSDEEKCLIYTKKLVRQRRLAICTDSH